MFVLTNTAGASATTPPASKTTLFVDASGVPSTKNNGGTVTPLLTGPAAALAYQPLDADLTGIAGLTYAADKSIYYTGSAWATYDLTAAGRTLSGVAGTANTFPYFSAANVVTLASITATGRAVAAATDAAAARTAIGAADATAVVDLTTNQIVAGVKTFTGQQLRMQSVGPGLWMDETDGNFGAYCVLDNNQLVIQARNTGFGAVVDTAARIHFQDKFIAFAYRLTPNSDNALDIGSGSVRVRTYYGVNSAINTSDARLKTEPRQLSDAERKAGSALARLPAIWEWLTGDRLHAGPTVQAAIAVMEVHGLDPFAYSFICYDEWEAEPEQWHEWPAKDAVLDDDGNMLEPAVEAGRELIQPAREAGDRYSFRKEELLCFMVSALAAENDVQAAKIEAMDARLAALEART